MYRKWIGATAVVLCVLVCLLAAGEEPGRSLPRRAAVDAYILGPTQLVAGSRASYRVAVHWASSAQRSGPLPGAAVTVRLAGASPETLARGITDAMGDVDLRFAVPRIKTGRHKLHIRVDARLGQVDREHEIRIFPGGQLLLTTDKKLYQPAQTIHIRTLALRSMDLKPVARRPVRIEVQDPKGNVVFSTQQRTSRFGVAATDFQLADEINLGSYTVRAWTDGADQNSRSARPVEVKRYVLPRFKVMVQTEHPYYQPGETVRGTVRSRYFFGKPVAGGSITLELGASNRSGSTRLLPVEHSDREGRLSFEYQLPATRHEGLGEVRVVATVRDTAGHREKGDVSVPLTSAPLRLSLVTENDGLVRAVPNRVHVVAGYPDGTPATRVTVTLRGAGGDVARQTDGLGLATFDVTPVQGRCPAGPGMRLTAEARDVRGQRGRTEVCATMAAPRAVVVRAVRSIVAPGEPVELELLAGRSSRAADNQVYLDVVKAGQTLATFSARLRRGRAHVRFQPDAALFGLLELRGYRLKQGERVGLSRMVYVDHPGELRISITPERKVYRPGERARLRFETVDGRTGDGVSAALGVVGVDEAVVAMGGLALEDSPKVFFTLASQAMGTAPAVRPGGRDLERWIDTSDAEQGKVRARAADVLLAALRPAKAEVWETNPWRERARRWERQGPALVQAAVQYMRDHSVGKRTPRGWRFHPDLVARMAADGEIKSGERLDPWMQPVRPWDLHRVDPSFVFDDHARRLAPERLRRIYSVLTSSWKDLNLPRERMKKLSRQKWPLVLPRTLLSQLVQRGKLRRAEIVDPWGKPYVVGCSPRTYVNPYYTGLVSRCLIHSAGPDGISGTRDDVGPEGPRISVRNGALESATAHALGQLIGDAIGEARGVGGLGLLGVGRGGGGAGFGSIGIGRLGTIGHGGASGMPARVRSKFPETLLWQPELVTDGSGRATLDFELADSITDWRIMATGSTEQGLLGTAGTTLRVFQDFFVDIDLPAALTQKDRISLPVTVYNYLKTKQRVTLRLKRERWFSPAGPTEQTITLEPNQVGVRHFPIVAQGLGRQDLTVHATASGGQADAVRRTTLVEPDGVQRALSIGGSLRPDAASDHELVIPDQAITGSGHVQLAIYAGPMGQTLDGLEGMLRQPGGCFEQTSSSTYPNVLVLDYLKRNKLATPAVEQRAKQYINDGYQRLVGFEVGGGGFSWFGNAPANKVLTAYGLMEFFDMARVHPVDPRLIARTQRWLARQQKRDGNFGPDGHSIDEGATSHFHDQVRITAYVAHALRHTGYRGREVGRAMKYLRAHIDQASDAYTLAVLGNLMADDTNAVAREVRRRLWKLRRSSDKGLFLDGPRSTLTYGGGQSGQLETTALGALALLASREAPGETSRLVDTLVASKDSFGSWHSTQATILSLRALLLQQEMTRDRPAGEVQVLVDGQLHRRVKIEGDRDTSHQLDLTAGLGRGRHRVALRFSGKGNLQYHLAGRYWMPRAAPGPVAPSTFALTTRYNRQQVRQGEQIQLHVEVKNRSRRRVEMPLVSVSLPPGFTLQEDGLTDLVKAGKVDKVQRLGNQAVLYLTRMPARGALRFALDLRARYPLRVQARSSTVYEYYRPENRVESPPQRLSVL